MHLFHLLLLEIVNTVELITIGPNESHLPVPSKQPKSHKFYLMYTLYKKILLSLLVVVFLIPTLVLARAGGGHGGGSSGGGGGGFSSSSY